MRRIGLAVVLAVGLVLAPVAGEAQQAGKVTTVGILAIEPYPPIDSFRQRLRELGYIEDKNVRVSLRGGTQPAAEPALALIDAPAPARAFG